MGYYRESYNPQCPYQRKAAHARPLITYHLRITARPLLTDGPYYG